MPQLASFCAISEATLSRFVRKMDYRNFQDFSRSIYQRFHAEKELLKVTAKNDFSERFLKRSKYALEHIISKKTNTTILNLVQDLAKINNPKLLFFGLGSSATAAQEMFYNFAKINFSVFFSESIERFLPVLANSNKNTFLFFFSNRLEHPWYKTIFKFAERLNIKIVLVTTNNERANFLKHDYLILHHNLEQSFRSAAQTSKLSQSIIGDLIFNIFLLKHPQYQKTILNSQAIIKQFFQHFKNY